MAQIVEVEEPQGEFAEIDIKLTDSTEAEPKIETTEAESLPEKYKGKSAEDLVKMHQEAERLIGRQAQEVGEVRKLADELIKSQLTKKAEPEQPEVDFFSNPKEAIRQAVENNPKVIAAEQQTQVMRREQAKQMLMQKHPDYQNVTQDAEFVNWVKSSPIRTQLFGMADAFNVDAADELLSTFKQLHPATKPIPKEEVKSREKQLKAAAVETGGTTEGSKKIYRRTDLIRLNMTNPSRYAELSEEITLAYAEGRVR